MKRLVLAAALLLGGSVRTSAQGSAPARHAITFDDFIAVHGVGDPQLSPDGSRVLYALTVANEAANRRVTRTFLSAMNGGRGRQFPDDSTKATEARWSPDGKWVAYVADGQLWVADINGVNRRQLTTLTGGATGPVWSPQGDRIAFSSGVYPGCTTDACDAQRDSSANASQVHAHETETLLFRHWNAWDPGYHSHLWVVAVGGGAPKDLTPAILFDVPPGPFGGSEAYAWSPDGREIVYTGKDQGAKAAWTTDNNLYLVPSTGGASRVITAANTGADENPVYSPDGKYIVYHSQATGGYESDRFRLMFYDRAHNTSREVLPGWDRWADSYVFADPHTLLISSAENGRQKTFRSTVDDAGHVSTPTVIVGEHTNTLPSVSADGRTLAWEQDAADHPSEIYSATLEGAVATGMRQVTHENDDLVAKLDMHPLEDYQFTGADGTVVHGWVLKPPGFDARKKTPVILLIHGGPQVPWVDDWHGRWNYQMFAATAGGSALVIINPRGSPGYGQKFIGQVSHDWGDRAYTDLMRGLSFALARNSWMDSTRMAAAGGSYGGYMVDWIAGHTHRFKALVSHAGVYDLESMAGATEELWFVDYEFGSPYDATALSTQYNRWSPHRFSNNFKTPTLVITGQQDFRVPYTQSLEFFTALQRHNVPSKLIVFDNEGHWIGKPQDQRLWWGEVQGWMGKYFR